MLNQPRLFGGASLLTEIDMKILENIQIAKNDNGTFTVFSESHDEVVDCKNYDEAFQVFQEFFGGIMDVHNDFLVEKAALHLTEKNYV